MIMDESDTISRAAYPAVTRAGRTASELLEDTGNCRQITNLHRLSASLFSEQRKLKHALDWAHSFLSSGSEIHHELCRADSLILADEELRETQKKSPACEHSSADKYHHPGSCTTGGNQVFRREGAGGGGGRGGITEKVWHPEPSNYEKSDSNNHVCAYKSPFSVDSCIPFFLSAETADVSWSDYRETLEHMKSKEEDATNTQTPNQDADKTSDLFIPNQRQQTYLSARKTIQTSASDGATGLIKDSTSCWSNTRHKKTMVQLERDISGHEMEMSKVKVEGKVGTKKEAVRMGILNEGQDSAFMMCAMNDSSNSEPEKTQEQMKKSSNVNLCCHLKRPPTLTVYEQYQLYMDQLHRLRMRQSQHVEPGCFLESPAKDRKTSEEEAAPPTSDFELNSSTTNTEIKKCLNKTVTAAEITKERSSGVINKNQGSPKYNTRFSEQGQTNNCDNLKETPAAICAESGPVCQRNTSNTHLDLHSNKCVMKLIKGTAGSLILTDKPIKTHAEHLDTAPGDNVPTVEETAALTPNPGLRTGCHPGVKGCQSRVIGQKKKSGVQRASLSLCEKSRVSLSSLTDKEILQRPRSSGVIKHTKRHTPEDKVKPSSVYRDTHKFLQPTETHTPLHDDPRPTSPTSGAYRCEQTDCKYSPAGVSVRVQWLCLPDEVWLSILSLLPHSDLCRVLQVCSRLHTLATDHTLWERVRIENSNLTEQWLLCVSRRRPRRLCLYSCSGPSLTSCGLQMIFSLCRNTLQELKVTSCTGPGLHGDQMLLLIGQLCDHVTSVDVSWSGATDTGVKALGDCGSGLRLKSVVLNGCHVTDDPLVKLVMRHKESLCRLEVFGCQFLTPSCLQTVYEVCPGLQHLNIGQVPKVNAHCLTVMTLQLKCLISLNVTGLQAVTDAAVDTLLQNCVKLQSLTFSSCPGVTDMTLHRISKYTTCIRSLDVSGCKAVTDAGVQSLALRCRRLQQLDLSSTGTGNRGVTLLANYCSGHLHTVKLSFCHITSESILKLCRRCKRLEVLHLYGSAHLPTEREIREVNTTVKVYPLP